MYVMNANGRVLTWKLTKSIKFDNVTDIFLALHHRLQTQSNPVKDITIDNCCSWRKKLHTIFGTDIKVSLDIFHAVQRVMRTISKKHKLSHLFCEQFRLIFRGKHDKGQTCTLTTPNPGKIVCTYVLMYSMCMNYSHISKICIHVCIILKHRIM